MEQLGIEPRTSPMLREHYTTKPQPHFDINTLIICHHKPMLTLPGLPGCWIVYPRFYVLYLTRR
ncbi:hypothetical protein BDW71DRAFT_181899 [Aspergillus fruticulosus]